MGFWGFDVNWLALVSPHRCRRGWGRMVQVGLIRSGQSCWAIPRHRGRNRVNTALPAPGNPWGDGCRPRRAGQGAGPGLVLLAPCAPGSRGRAGPPLAGGRGNEPLPPGASLQRLRLDQPATALAWPRTGCGGFGCQIHPSAAMPWRWSGRDDRGTACRFGAVHRRRC